MATEKPKTKALRLAEKWRQERAGTLCVSDASASSMTTAIIELTDLTDARQKGGSAKSYDKHLQTFISLLYEHALEDFDDPTLPEILKPISGYSRSEPFDMFESKWGRTLARVFDDVFIEDQRLYWRNSKGGDGDCRRDSLYPYLRRSKESFGGK
jgi:hypothetical protein